MRADSLVWAACAAAVGVVVPLCGCRSTARATNACGQLGVGGLRRRCRRGSAAVGCRSTTRATNACGQLGVGGLRRRCRCGSAAVGVLQHYQSDQCVRTAWCGRPAPPLSASLCRCAGAAALPERPMRADSLVWAACAAAVGVVLPLSGAAALRKRDLAVVGPPVVFPVTGRAAPGDKPRPGASSRSSPGRPDRAPSAGTDLSGQLGCHCEFPAAQTHRRHRDTGGSQSDTRDADRRQGQAHAEAP